VIQQAAAQAPGQVNTDEYFLGKEKKKKDGWFKLMRMKKCPIKSCDTKMVHTHNGKKFRGRKWWQLNKNPKTGELAREPVTDPKKRKKSSKVRKHHEYQKEFELPEKSN
jgi:hypothetical protein